jgi:hypothetical protein
MPAALATANIWRNSRRLMFMAGSLRIRVVAP